MPSERLTMTVEEAGEMLGISRSLAYEMARSGQLPSLRFGKRLVVSRRAVERLLEDPQKTGRLGPECSITPRT